MEFTTADKVLTYAGVKSPSQAETDWADACAKAVNDGIVARLNGAVVATPTPPELETAATMAGGEAYKRREAPFGVTSFADVEGAIRIARDYLDGVKPIIDRYGNGPGIG